MGSLRSLRHNPLPRKGRTSIKERRWHYESKIQIKKALKSQLETLTFKVSVKTDPNYPYKPENSVYWQKSLQRLVRVEWDIGGLVIQEQILDVCRGVVDKVCRELKYTGYITFSLEKYYLEIAEILP